MTLLQNIIRPIETYSTKFNKLIAIKAKYLRVPEGPEAKEIWIQDLEHRLDRELLSNYRVLLPPLLSNSLNRKELISDAFDPETLTLFEYNDDQNHGNPNLYPNHLIHPQFKVPYGLLFTETERKRKIFNMLGYPVWSRWQSNPY